MGSGKVFLRDTAGSSERTLSGQDSSILPARVANHNKQAYGMQNTIEIESENAASVYT